MEKSFRIKNTQFQRLLVVKFIQKRLGLNEQEIQIDKTLDLPKVKIAPLGGTSGSSLPPLPDMMMKIAPLGPL